MAVSELIGREPEFEKLRNFVMQTSAQKGTTVLVQGQHGIGKSQLLRAVAEFATEQGFECLVGNCSPYAEHEPYHPFIIALSQFGESVFVAETHVAFSEVFVINEAGLLISYKSTVEHRRDEDILGGMLSAVQNFVRDSFGDIEDRTAGGLAKLEYKDTKILLEHGSHVFVAGVVAGDEHPDMRPSLRQTLDLIETQYGSVLEKWDGSYEKVAGIENFLTSLLTRKYMLRRNLEYARLEEEQVKVFENVTAMLIEESKKKPLILILEDLQWMDRISFVLMEYLARNITTASILLCASVSMEELSENRRTMLEKIIATGQVTTISLQPLSRTDAIRLMQAVFSTTQLSPSLENMLFEQSKGNPFYLREYMRTLKESHNLQIVDGFLTLTDIHIPQPSSVADTISLRLERLNDEAIEVLEYCAVSGLEVKDKDLHDYLDSTSPALQPYLDELVNANLLIRTPEGYQFENVLVQQIVYDGISERWKRLAHRKIGNILETKYAAEIDRVIYQLAHHFSQTSELQKALKYNILAGDKAAAFYAVHDAITYYTRAVSILTEIGMTEALRKQRFELFEKLGDISLFSGEFDATERYYAQAHELEKEPHSEARIYRKLAVVAERRGEYVKGIGLCKSGLETLKYTDIPLLERGLLFCQLGRLYARRSEYEEAIECYNNAFKVLQFFPDEKRWLAEAYNSAGIVRHREGNYSEARILYEKALKLREEINDPVTIAASLNNFGMLLRDMGELDRALEYVEKGLQIREKLHDVYGSASSYTNIGTIYKERGELKKAIEYYEKSLTIQNKIGDLAGMGISYNNIGIVYKELGELDKAISYYQKSLELREKIGDLAGIAASHNNMGSVLIEKGEPDNALKYFSTSLKLRERIGHTWGIAESYLNIGAAQKELGNLDETIAWCTKSLALAEKNNFKDLLCEGKRLLGVAYQLKSEFELATQAFEDCIKLCEAIGNQQVLALSCLEFGLMEKYRNSSRAKKLLSIATKIFRKEKKLKKAEECEQHIRELRKN